MTSAASPSASCVFLGQARVSRSEPGCPTDYCIGLEGLGYSGYDCSTVLHTISTSAHAIQWSEEVDQQAITDSGRETNVQVSVDRQLSVWRSSESTSSAVLVLCPLLLRPCEACSVLFYLEQSPTPLRLRRTGGNERQGLTAKTIPNHRIHRVCVIISYQLLSFFL
jgi:hypothetical protein